MLFNTLTYAKFFAVVFLVSWLLVRRRWALVLPWAALAGLATTVPLTLSTGGVAALALLLTLALSQKAEADEIPSRRAAAASLAINGVAMCWLSFGHAGIDPLSYALRGIGVPVGPGLMWSAPMLVLGAGLSYALIRAKKVRLLFIMGASYVFYAHWDWRFLPLIWGSSTIDWLLGNAIYKAKEPHHRKLWLGVTVGVNLGILGLFKYFNFGVETVSDALSALGYEPPKIALRIALPIGISFFTFESMSYVIDVYRRHIEPQKSYAEYLAFVAFFPHLVAGPIVRPRDLLPQLAGIPRFSVEASGEALFLIAVGLLKKVAIGDYLAVGIVDRVFDAPIQYSSLECYAAVLGYAVQIYCDFSGYTDIAIGSALLLGVRFPLNFNAPYKSTNISEFWRRWHISLSSWLRDYLYIPLGGNRKGLGRTYVNLMLTMLLGGLWHGASWTFVVWGGIQGVALAATRYALDRRQAQGKVRELTLGRRLLGVFLTFHLVCASWIFFRSDSFHNAWLFFGQLAQGTTHHVNLSPQVLAVLAVGLLSHWMPESWYLGIRSRFIALPMLAQAACLVATAYALDRMATAEVVPFVYFQF